MFDRPIWYILKDKQPVPTHDVLEWGMQLADVDSRRVAFTEVAPGVEVSTVFIGIDSGVLRKGAPLLFETMGFSDYGDNFQYRYATWTEAELGHMEIVEALRKKFGLEQAETSAGNEVLTSSRKGE